MQNLVARASARATAARDLWRGFIKANLIHHLAHTADASVLVRIGKAWSFKGVPEPGSTHLDVFAIPTKDLKPEHLSFHATTAWEHAVKGLNYLRLWGGGQDWFEKAQRHLEEAVKLDPSEWHHLLRAEARRSRVDYAGALSDYEAAGTGALALAFKARVLFQMRTEPGDMKVIDRAIAAAPREGWIRAWRGEAYRRLGRMKDAEKDLREALALDPLYDQAYGWLARVLEATGRPEEAAEALKKGIALCPDFEKAYRPLVRALRGAGRVGEALEALDRAAALNHRNGWLGPWRVEGQTGGEAEAALSALREWTAEHPEDVRAKRWLGEALTQLGRHEEALTALAGDAHPWARAWLGEALYRLGRKTEALTALDAAVAGDRDYGRAWAWRGRLKADAKDWRGALADYDEALGRRRVEYAWISAWRGEALFELGRVEQARRELDAAVALDAPNPVFRRLRARARYALRDAAGACEDLLNACADGALPWPAIAAAEALRRAGKTEDALRAVDALCKEHAKEAPFLLLLRYRLKAALGAKAAHRDVDAAFRADPKVGWVFGVEPLPEDAPEAYAFLQDASFADDPACGAVWAYQGQARLQRGDAGGLQFLERAAALAPEGWILAWLGEARRQAGDRDGAVQALDAALAADPRYANVWGWRATLKLGDDPEAAEADLTKALKLQKTARFYRDRSVARRALKDLKGAAADMEAAVRLNPDLSWDKPSPEAFERCPLPGWKAELALRLGWKEKAKKLLAKAKTPLELVWRAECDLESPRAGKDLAAALKKEPKLAQAWALKAKREKSSIAALKAIRFAPYCATYRLLAARMLKDEGKLERAKEEARTALAISHSFGEASIFLRELENPASPMLEFFTNYSCNAKCPFCFNPPEATAQEDKGLPYAELAKRLYQGYERGYRGVKFIGGEATMRDDLPKLVALARKIGYRGVQLTTNGIRLADPAYARMLADVGVDDFRFSIHGHTPALHDGLVGVPGALEKIGQAIANLRPMDVRFGINYVLNAVNYKKLPETLIYFHEKLKIDDVIVYFLRYQGFAELPQNEEKLALRFKDAVPYVRQAFGALAERGAAAPSLIHFVPCVAPELEAHMLDWRRAPEDVDRVTLPNGREGRIDDVTNEGKRPVAACANCSKRRVCFGVEERYVARYGDREFKPA